MKERPILFSGPMVRAILDGTKTQTRRPADLAVIGRIAVADDSAAAARECCPFGQPGDRLWVRETWVTAGCRKSGCLEEVQYRADEDDDAVTWFPSIHMPRWASRIALEIVSVRVERLKEISRGDAMAEGCPHANMTAGPDPREWFADVWRDSYGAGSWSANPWVWVLEFRRVQS